jgi:hypothetical protein
LQCTFATNIFAAPAPYFFVLSTTPIFWNDTTKTRVWCGGCRNDSFDVPTVENCSGGDRCFFDITNLSVRITDQCFWLSSLFLSSGNSTAIPVRGRSTWHGTEFCLFITSKTVSACRIFRLDAFPDGTCVCNSAILIGRQPDLSSVWLGKEIKPPHFRFPLSTLVSLDATCHPWLSSSRSKVM